MMTDKMVNKCIFCNSELTTENIVISSNGWVYCKICRKPILDITIQDEGHWIKKNIDKIEKAHYMDLLFQGYC